MWLIPMTLTLAKDLTGELKSRDSHMTHRQIPSAPQWTLSVDSLVAVIITQVA